MGFFSFIQEIAMDLGTANTIIISDDKIVVDEPSVVALDRRTDKMIAVGEKAKMMYEKTHDNIRTIRPLRDGVIADFEATELMLRGLIKKVGATRGMFAPSLRMMICIPSGSTNVEIRAVRESAQHAGGREIYLLFEPMAAALGAGLDVEAPEGNLIIDIGGGTSEIACISLGGIVCSKSINVAGDVFTNDIQNYIRQQHGIRIGERTAEEIKCAIGAAIPELENEPEDYVFTGSNMLTNLPQTVTLNYSEIAYALDKSLVKLDNALMEVLEEMPPELYSDVVKNGIYLAGGGALIKGLDVRLSKKSGLPVHIAEDPLRAIARGTCIALKNIGNFSFLIGGDK
jgi:rod shape-determining protein MreB